LSVRAVGTRFFVRADDTQSPAGVVEGSVDVAASGRPVRVSAGEALHRTGATLSVAPADVDRATAWRMGRLVFSGERLSTVLTELDRYRRGSIILLDAAAGERRVTGSFDPHDTDEALDAIASSMGVSITRLSPFLVLVGSPLRRS
jgi:transmembrane sensor